MGTNFASVVDVGAGGGRLREETAAAGGKNSGFADRLPVVSLGDECRWNGHSRSAKRKFLAGGGAFWSQDPGNNRRAVARGVAFGTKLSVARRGAATTGHALQGTPDETQRIVRKS